MIGSATVIILLVLSLQVSVDRPRAQCRDLPDCRQRALEAVSRSDYETFHDYAWRVVQTAPANDAAALFLLARAQSLSGRPLDAAVVLRRIAASGQASAAHEVLTSDEFERVRALAQWSELEAVLKGGSPVAKAKGGGAVPAAPVATDSRDAHSFDAASFKPAALAYDRVSRRFIIADSDISRLAVVDEFSHHVATLASGRPGGFGTVTAIEIDPRVGNLWVASLDESSGTPKASLHKLQLISGRMLKTFPVAGKAAAATFTDIAVERDGGVVAVDATTGTVFRLRPGAASLQAVAQLRRSGITSVAPAGDSVYVAHADGIDRVGASGAVEALSGEAAQVDVKRCARIRWTGGSLVAVQAIDHGVYRIIRIRLRSDGRAAVGVDVLDGSVKTSHPAAAAVSDGVLYYLVDTAPPALGIRRVDVTRR